MFSLTKAFEIEKKYDNHDISARDSYGNFKPLVSGFLLALNGAGRRPTEVFLAIATHTYYRLFDRSNPDDFYACSQITVKNYMSVNVILNRASGKHKVEYRLTPSLLITVDETVDKRVEMCYDVLKARQNY